MQDFESINHTDSNLFYDNDNESSTSRTESVDTDDGMPKLQQEAATCVTSPLSGTPRVIRLHILPRYQ